MTMQIDSIAQWLIDSANEHTDLRLLTNELVTKLRTAGMPIDRLNLGVLAIHPEMAGYAVLWETGMTEAVEFPIRREDLEKPTYLHSPIRHVVEQRETVRFNLQQKEGELTYPVLQEFRENGYRQYIGFPVPFGEGGVAVLTLCTAHPNGFQPSQVDGLTRIFNVLSLLLTVVETQRMTRTMLQTYLGRYTADRVLAGEILRGQGKEIQAAIWMCDLRDFTAMTSDIGSFQMIDVMNQYFDCMAQAVWEEDGEILKFMGDAMLVVFKIGDRHSPQIAAKRALRSARTAIDNLRVVSNERTQQGLPALHAGISLHLGAVVYGNIGATSRLDFTVMGAAVNLVARIQSLAGTMGEEILFSEEIAAHHDPVVSVGVHTFKGVSKPVEIFKPDDPNS